MDSDTQMDTVMPTLVIFAPGDGYTPDVIEYDWRRLQTHWAKDPHTIQGFLAYSAGQALQEIIKFVSTQSPQNLRLCYSGHGADNQRYRIVATPFGLPSYHRTSGHHGWIFQDDSILTFSDLSDALARTTRTCPTNIHLFVNACFADSWIPSIQSHSQSSHLISFKSFHTITNSGECQLTQSGQLLWWKKSWFSREGSTRIAQWKWNTWIDHI
ncbi:hypothetical protein DFJ74DRAFT_662902 [Hyaloraphidium curvatum]|nr:hypothetical protein DFJ74DRAFT_662902 [Hyaloraphidium curvatum]